LCLIRYNEAVEELSKLKTANNNSLKRDKSMKSFRGTIDLDTHNKESNSMNHKEKNLFLKRAESSLRKNFSVEKFIIKKEDQTLQFSHDFSKKNFIGLKKNLDFKGFETKLNFRILGKTIMDQDRDKI
jgi:hypothetical protein